jgi:Mrp family chromosome partitioning ATPase
MRPVPVSPTPSSETLELDPEEAVVIEAIPSQGDWVEARTEESVEPSPPLPVDEPKPRKWIENQPTTLWQSPEKSTPGRKRQTAPYVSRSVGPVPVPPEEYPGDEEPTAPPPRTPGPVVVRLTTPDQSQSRARRPVTGERQLDARAGGRPEPLMIEAPLLIRIRNVERLSPDPRLWLMTKPGSAMAEQFRVLSLKLKEARGLRVVTLVSPTLETDGALAAANVALALGEGTRNRVLLLDTNLRRPQIGELFGLPDSPGLSEQVRRHRRQPTDPWEVGGISGTVSVLTAGAVEKNPSAVLSSESIGELLQEARRAFDYIVVSAPPVLLSADTNILLDHLDGAILVVKVGTTRRDSVQASVERLGARHFLGTVMVGVKKA